MPTTRNRDAVVKAGRGYYWEKDATGVWAAVTVADLEAFVTDTATFPSGWSDFGHTDGEAPIAWGQEGGETEVFGSWQDPALVEAVTKDAVDYIIVSSLQFLDEARQKDYWGGGTSGAGFFDIPNIPTAREREILACAINFNGAPFGLQFPRVSIRRDDSFSLPTDGFAKMPLRMTLLSRAGAPRCRIISSRFTA